jgi:hypothetical protein
MNCPKCNIFNEQGNLFCVNCGETLSVASNLPQTVISNQNLTPNEPRTEEYPSIYGQNSVSQPTVHSGIPNYNTNQNYYQNPQANHQYSQPNFQPSMSNFNPSLPYIPPPAKKSRAGLLIGLGLLVVLFLGGGAIGTFLLINKPLTKTETLPEHLGMFFQNADKTQISELKKQDFTNTLTAKDTILKDGGLSETEAKPNIILYSDGKDIPLADLKVVDLESINKDGTMKQIEYKAAPVEGKPEMKRIWFNENLAKGKYAFAVFDGYFDEGKHKFWAFEVKNSDRSDNDDLAKSASLNLKNKSVTPQKTTEPASNSNVSVETKTDTKVPAPSNSTVAYCTSNNVVLRSGASQNTGKIGSLYRGQKIYVIQYSGNYETFVDKNGREFYANYAYIQTESGKRGWVYTAYIR